MSKRVRTATIVLHIDYVTGTKKVDQCSYSLDDDAAPGASHTPVGAIDRRRNLTNDELIGTLDDFISDCKTAAETAEGI